jgi:ABC-2 type transport system permease protein
MTLLTVYMPLWILKYGKISVGHILVGYTGLLLLGAAALAIGVFASALARSQVVAAIVGAATLAGMIVMWMLARAADPPLNRFLSALALHHNNFMPFKTGVLELGSVAYYLAVTYFFLLAATKVLEARRWR